MSTWWIKPQDLVGSFSTIKNNIKYYCFQLTVTASRKCRRKTFLFPTRCCIVFTLNSNENCGSITAVIFTHVAAFVTTQNLNKHVKTRAKLIKCVVSNKIVI